MSIGETTVEINIDDVNQSEEVAQAESGNQKEDSLENVRKDLEAFRGEFVASANEAASGRKELSTLRETVTRLKERLEAWEGIAEKRRELIQRLVGVDGPSDATRRKMAIP